MGIAMNIYWAAQATFIGKVPSLRYQGTGQQSGDSLANHSNVRYIVSVDEISPCFGQV